MTNQSSHAPVSDPLQQWPGMEKLTSVQDLLDQNKMLITEINQNHELKTPDALARNTLLINQLNTNVSKVVSTYSLLASQVEGDQLQQQPQQPPQHHHHYYHQ